MALKTGRGAAAAPFLVMDVIAAANAKQASARAGAPGVIRMEVGQPGTGAPAGAAAAATAAIARGEALGYTEALGRPSLRARIARHYGEWYGLDLAPGRVAVTLGASGAFPLAFLAAFDPTDRVALTAPFYPPYRNILTALGLSPVILETTAETRFQPTIALLERITPRPDGLIIASPSNPAGSMLTPAELEAIARFCHANGIRLISDEIYHGIQYGTPIATAAAFSPSAIVINSFSKYFSMTGWRVGWMVLPEDLVRPVECLAQNFFISAPHIAQVAAEAALACGAELEANIARYRRSRDLLLRALPDAGFPELSPAEGAFYLFADVSSRTNDSVSFAARMLAETSIAVTPGVDFDHRRGRSFLRFSYCGPESDMAEAARRLADWR
ncbi:MAG: pyridoxal phosphate-dependent aminotransferase [Acetobacteraceae bacterium]